MSTKDRTRQNKTEQDRSPLELHSLSTFSGFISSSSDFKLSVVIEMMIDDDSRGFQTDVRKKTVKIIFYL